MKYGIFEALKKLTPMADFSITGNDYTKIKWQNKNIRMPSLQEVELCLEEMHNEEPMRLLRIERNKLLAMCDWVVCRDLDMKGEISSEWKEYRQKLRDLPMVSNPSLNEKYDLNLNSVEWPIPPKE